MLLLTTGLLALLTLSNAGGDHIKGGSHIKGAGTHVVPQEIHQEEANLNIKTAAAYSTKTIVPSSQDVNAHGVIEFREPVTKQAVNPQVISTVRTSKPVVALHDEHHHVKTIASTTGSNVKTSPPVLVVNEQRPTPVVKGGSDVPPDVILKQSVPFASMVGVRPATGPTILNSGVQLSGGAREVIVYEDGSIEEVGGGRINLPQGSISSIGGSSAVFSSGVSTRGDGTAGNVDQGSRRPIAVPVSGIEQRRPAAIKPIVVGSAVAGQDQRYRLPLRPQVQPIPKSPVLSPVIPRPQISQPKPQVDEGIISLNRKLVEKQNQEDLKQTLSGVVKVDSNLSGVSLTAGELDEISRRLGGQGGVQIVTKEEIKPAVVTAVRPAVVRQRIPAPVQPVTTVFSRDERFKYTGTRVAPGALSGGGRVSITDFGMVSPLRPAVTVQTVPQPGIQFTSPVYRGPQVETDIVALNRQLIEKQNQENLQQTLSGVVQLDSGIGGASLSAGEIGEIYRRLSGGASGYVVPTSGVRTEVGVLPVRPAVVAQRIPTPIKPKVTIQDETFKYTGARGSVRQTGGAVRTGVISGQAGSAIRDENYFILGNTVDNIGGVRYGVRGPAIRKPQISISEVRKPAVVSYVTNRLQTPAAVRPKPQYSVPAVGEDIVSLNRQLIQKQNQEELTRTLAGVVKSESDIGRVSLSSGELEEISRRLGAGAPNPVPVRPVELPRVQPTLLRQQTPPVAPKLAISPPVLPRQPISLPIPVAPVLEVPATPLGEEIILLNRQLIEKQNQEDLKLTLEGVLTPDSDLEDVSLSSGDLGEISRRVSGQIVTTQEVRRPAVPVRRPVAQRIPAAVGPQVISSAGGVSAGYGSRIAALPVRTSVPYTGPQVSPAAIPRPQINAQAIPQPQPVAGVGDDIRTLNRNLIAKQTDEGFLQTLRGVVKADSELDGVSITSDEYEDISKLVDGTGRSVSTGDSPSRPAQSAGATRYSAGVDIRSQTISRPGASRPIIRPGVGLRSSAGALGAANFGSRRQIPLDPQRIDGQDRIEPAVVVQEHIDPSLPASHSEGQLQIQLHDVPDHRPVDVPAFGTGVQQQFEQILV